MFIHAANLNSHASGNVINIYNTVFLSLGLALEYPVHHRDYFKLSYLINTIYYPPL